MQYNGTIKINLDELSDIYDALSGKKEGEVYDLLDEANDYIAKMKDIIDEELKGASITKLSRNLSDIDDSHRGLKNNLEDISKNLQKYIESRKEGIEIVNEGEHIIIDEEISECSKRINEVNENLSAILSTSFSSLPTLTILDDEIRGSIKSINQRIDTTNQLLASERSVIETKLYNAEELCITAKRWHKDDFSEFKSVAKFLVKTAVLGTIAMANPIALGVVVGTVAAKNFYEDGYKITESLVIGAVNGALAYAGEIIGAKISAQIGKVMQNGIRQISSYCDDLIRQFDFPDDLIRERLKSISNKRFSFMSFKVITDDGSFREVIWRGKDWDRILRTLNDGYEFKDRVLIHLDTGDFENMYLQLKKDAMEKGLRRNQKYSFSKVSGKGSDSVLSKTTYGPTSLYSELKSQMDYTDSLNQLGKRVVDGALDETINEYTDNLLIEETELNLNSMEIDDDFKKTLVGEIKDGIVAGLVSV